MQRTLVHKNKLYTIYRKLVILENNLTGDTKSEVGILLERMMILLKTAKDEE